MPAPILQSDSLTWGVLQLHGPETDDLFEIETMGETHFGNPVPVIEAVRSLLIDGALAAVTGWDNREIPIRVRISANDGEALAEAEASLVQQCLVDRPSPLVWTPPIGLAATNVFDVVVAKLDRDTADGWDAEEVTHGYRYYLLTLTCLPFARAVESTVVEALAPVPASPTTVNIDAGNSTTGWTADGNDLASGPTVVSGSVRAVGDTGTTWIQLERTAALVTMGTTPYLEVDAFAQLSSGSFVNGTLTVEVNGTEYDPVAIGQFVPGAHRKYYYDLTGEAFTVLTIKFEATAPDAITLSVNNIARTDTIGLGSSTARQQSRSVTVTGSAPTQAAIRLFDATPADLAAPTGTYGDILIYTTRSTTPPNLRQWYSSGGTDALDADLITGKYTGFTSPVKFLIPAETLTLGTYALLGRIVNINTAKTLTWQVRMATLGGATNVVGSDLIISGEVEIPAGAGVDDFKVFDLGSMILPTVEVEANFAIELTISTTGTGTEIVFDEMWLFGLDDGALTWIHDNEGLDWVEVRSPELGAARPSVWGGRNAVGAGGVCIDWKCESFGAHRFDPGTMQVFTVVTSSLVSQCELEFFPRFHSHVWGQETS